MPTPLPETKVEAIRKTLESHNTWETAYIENVSMSVVSQIRNNTYRPGLSHRRKKAEEIRLLLLDGYTGRETARLAGVHESTVSKIKRQMRMNGELE